MLNKITTKDRYPLPLIEDQLDRLHGKKCFTKLDLRNAFHHIKIAEESIKYTSFVSPLGQYEYTKMPFGWCNSPSVFMRYINQIFRTLILEKKICIYLDLILIATETIAEHISVLNEVLHLLSDNLLELCLDKCVFLMTDIIYLGYSFNEHGIFPSKEHIEAVMEYPVPKNTKEVQSFVGLVSYFRKFIANFSIIAKPLYDLLKKSAVFVFGTVELRAFENLKNKLISAPVLCIYNPNAETQLHYDASSLGFGSALLQKQPDGKFHPIAYYSKRASPAESKYHSFEMECLCIIYSLKRFHVYLYGIPFTIVTDCNSLKLTLDKRDINMRVAGWALTLQSYNYTAVHRPGVRMTHVNTLSRCHNILLLDENTFEQKLSLQQVQDVGIAKVRDFLEKSEHANYELRNGLVYRKTNNKILFIVPENMINQIIYT